ncbi:hypothetical protein A1O3_04431 [Capronia epimyces CBS 606.96]|uniref:WW domain-containing protein n=1 Tax=Capronia epimyces CBS 606.96 TaxID=1182542 RepID=W9YDY6_9EURO|nr:uncharacterized protein A1O3_04431 [Capronia epimyces CBS 606.96]EXJ87471.1 hypothetical protein A1O3_04431 [Capronia epimyces CBS 606.96]
MSYYDNQYQGQGQYGQQQSQQSYNGPPQVPAPWVAEWDPQNNRWLYVNRETGQRTFESPQQSYYGGNYGGDYGQEYTRQAQGEYYPQDPPKESHTGRNIALGAAAGVLGGAVLMHEGEKVEDKWDDVKYGAEDDVANGIQDVENFPENAARWTGEKVQDVEDIPQDIENKWDNGVQDVEDIPEDVSGWVGRKVGDVDRFGDNIDDAYDQGRNDTSYDDNRY